MRIRQSQNEVRAFVVDLVRHGFSVAHAARETGVPYKTVDSWVRRGKRAADSQSGRAAKRKRQNPIAEPGAT